MCCIEVSCGILEEGFVKTGDEFTLIEPAINSLTTHQFYDLLFSKDKNQEHLALAIENEALPLGKRERLRAFII